jgi:diguanylate cyclase (GGDEF)-like protein/PAS domain S-box-containing protein
MTPAEPLPGTTMAPKLATLIETLHSTEQQLEELTAGQVDTVANQDGQIILLRRAQEYLRQNEAAKQAAIVNALPAHIALLNWQGIVISVNAAWRRFARENGFQGDDNFVGLDYLAICDGAHGDDAVEAHRVAAGIRALLSGRSKSFSIEYPCHSPQVQRWFVMTATPLANDAGQGVVVMHLDTTAERLSEARYRLLFDASLDAVLLTDIDGCVLAANPSACRMFAMTQDEICLPGCAPIVDADDPRVAVALAQRGRTGKFMGEMGFVRKGGERFAGELSTAVFRDKDGQFRASMIIRDITERKLAALELRESERRFSDMLGNVKLVSMMLDREARITYCNEFLLELTGWRMEEVFGRDWFALFVPPELMGLKDGFFAALLANETQAWHHDNDILTRSGERRVIRWNNSVLRSGAGDVIGTASIGEDITERRAAEARVAYLNRIYAMLSGINTLIVRARNRDELFSQSCRTAVETGGFCLALIVMVDPATTKLALIASEGKDAELLGKVTSILSSDTDAPRTMLARAIREKKSFVSNHSPGDPLVLFGARYADAGMHSMAIVPLMVAGEVIGAFALYASESDFFREDEMALVTELAGDISFAVDYLEKAEKINYLAYYDVLTGLANRSLFLERVAQYLRSAVSGGHGVALFLIDLERFKNINDSLGRQAGDALLRQVAQWLTLNIGDANLLARVGADHFALVLPEVRPDGDVARLLERSMEVFQAHPFRLNDAVFRIAAKVGVAVFPGDGVDAETLFKNAEAALKNAKASGARHLFYTRNMNSLVAGKLTLENQLRQALDNGEFVLYYQPKVNLVSGKVTSAEALIRWNDPRNGLVPPGRFIPILEETGLIHQVGRWAMRTAIEDYLRWRTAGLAAVRIAVNVSPLQLRNPDFIEEIRNKIGVDTHAAAGLELEITESLIMEDVKHNIASLRAVRAMGVSIAIDDFGTGFSSLSYLSKLPVDTLKIDRFFVTDMTASPEGLALVSTIINLAHSLKLKVVAEGVETEEQSRLLRLLDCDEMQGFFFSAALPCALFETRYLGAPPAV